jgi:PKD repeat protein
MKQEATFTNWDFTDIWGIIEDETYPYLQWQNVPPVANCGGPYDAPEGTEITFDASNSFDVDGDPLEYRWDFDNDGTWDTGWSSDPEATYTWYDDYNDVVKVEVSDGQFTSIDTASVLVSNVNPKALISGSIGIGEDYIFITNYLGQSYFVDIEDDGSLTTPQLMDDKDYGTYGAGIGDFDNDGDLDSLVGDFYNTWYFEKTGEGNNFAEAVSIESTPLTYSGDFAEADFNNDDNLDAIKASIMSKDMTLYSGNGDGTFGISTISGQVSIRGMDSGDFNNDGNMDLIAVTYRYQGKGYIYLGNGDGTFQTPTELSLSTLGAYGVCAGDFDNDGDDDLITCSYPSMYYPNNGDGTFGTPTNLGFSGLAIAESDLNNDGNLDLVYTDFFKIYFRAGNGDGTFSLISTSVAPSYGTFGIASTPDIMLMDEGEDTPFTGTFTDPGYLDTHTATWDWGDGSPIEPGIVTEENEYPDATGEVTGSHAYADNGYYTIILTVSDDEGAMSIDNGNVKVLNVAPTASIDSVDSPVPGFILPTDEVEFTGSYTDPGTADTHTIKWDFDDGTVLDDVSLTVTHAYSVAGEYNVTLTVTDDDGASHSVIVTITVNSLDDATEQINDYIQDIPDDAFDNNADQHQNALYEKLIENTDGDAVLQLIEAGLYEEALEKLRNDIRTKCDGSVGGNPSNDWVTDPDVQKELLAMIDALIEYLETLI